MTQAAEHVRGNTAAPRQVETPGAAVGRVPPHDLDAEAVVLSAVVLNPADAIPEVKLVLHPEHCYSPANRRILEAAYDLWDQHQPVDIVKVAGWLRDRGLLAGVGGAQYLAQVVDATPAVANVAAHAQTVHAKWRRRQLIQACQSTAGVGYGQDTETDALAVELRSVLDQLEATRHELDPWGDSLGWEHVTSPMSEAAYLCKPLGWSIGSVCGIGGYGYAGKTVVAEAALVQAAAGLPIWGQYGVERPARSLYLDYEQGKRLTLKRLQRLLRGLSLAPLDCCPIDVRCLPRTYLSDDGAERALVRMTAGYDLVLIDSFRAAFPAMDENKSESRSGIDMLRRVAAGNSLCVVILMHGRKPSKDDVGGQKTALRGSSALFDACDSMLMLEGRGKDERGRNVTCVTHTKNRETGDCLDQFELVIEDIGDPDHPRDGLFVGGQAILSRQDRSESKAKRESKQARADAETLVELMRGREPMSVRKMHGLCHQALGWGKPRTDLVLSAVAADKRLLTSLGERRATLYRHPDVQLTMEVSND